MARPEYMIIHSKYLPTEIRELYHIDGLISKYGYVYIKIAKGMYGLKQDFIIAHKQLISYMDTHGY